MGNKNTEIYLASPTAVAFSAIHGKITDPRAIKMDKGIIKIGETDIEFEPLPDKLLQILNMKGLVNYLSSQLPVSSEQLKAGLQFQGFNFPQSTIPHFHTSVAFVKNDGKNTVELKH